MDAKEAAFLALLAEIDALQAQPEYALSPWRTTIARLRSGLAFTIRRRKRVVRRS